ncbi:ATP-binding protein [Candidatus Marsarchaeota archaeon]|nr:ATP-binding protein [Candidatus Marsarchaeota archaeon]
MREEFHYIINEWLRRELPETVEREVEIDIEAQKVIAIAGVRRAGKTYLLFDIMKRLIKEGVPRKNLLYINFDDDRLQDLGSSDLDEMLNIYIEIADPGKDTPIFIFLDEIQNVIGWELWVRRIYDTQKYRLFITGSSSKLLSKEIATALVGRNITYVIYPFSFSEFLLSKGFNLTKETLYTSDIAKINRLAKAYLIRGGFPEVVLEGNEDTKQKILSSYYDAILYRDIVTRYRVKDANRLDMVFRYAVNTYASGFSTVKLNNYFKSQNIGVSRQTINNFVKYGEQTFLFYQLLQFFKSFKRSNQSRKKLYVVDNGIISLFTSNLEYGRLLENEVYVELLRVRERDPSIEIRYVASDDGEVDFVVSKKGVIIQAIQVAYELNAANRARELNPLLSIKGKLKPKRCILITFNPVDKRMQIDKGIDTMTFVEWILHNRASTLG